MRLTLLALVVAVDLAAIGALLTLPADGLAERPLVLFCLACLAGLTGFWPVRVPSLKLHFITSQPVILVAVVALRPMAAVIVTLTAVLAAAFRGWGDRATLRLAFNTGAMVVTVAATWWGYRIMGGTADTPIDALMFPAAAAALVFFLVNSVLMAAVVAVDQNRNLFRTWRDCFAWNAWCHLAGLTIAVAILAILDHALVWCLLLAAAPSRLLMAYYRSHSRKTATPTLDLAGP